MTTLDTRFGSAAVGAPPPIPGEADVPPEEQRGGRVRRRLAWAALALAALVGAVAAGRAWEAHGRVTVWMTTRDLAAGAAVTGDALRQVDMDAAPTDALATVPQGVVATVPLHAGSVLRQDDVGTAATPVPSLDEALVGLAAVPGRVPDGLRAGDEVRLVTLPPDPQPGRPPGKAQILLKRVTVQRVVVTSQGTSLTLVVPVQAAPDVAALSAANRIALVRLTPS